MNNRQQHQQLVTEGRQTVQNAPQLFIDLDVEADGKPGYGSLLSIGAVSPWGDSFYRELKPTSGIWIQGNRDFCEAHGLQRKRLLREGLDPSLAIAELDTWTRNLQRRYHKRGSVIVAFNASFDYPWIDLEHQKAGIRSAFGVAGYCIKSLALSLTEGYDWQQTAKNNLPAYLLPEGDFTHNALEDARYQQKLHFALVGRLAKR